MDDIRIELASGVPWADVEAALHAGDGASCWCQWAVNPGYPAMSRDERHDALREQLARTRGAPALVAYVGGLPAGWCRVASRVDQPRLARTRVVTKGTPEPMDDGSVWAVTCFVVRREFRRQGLSRALLDRAIAFARESGARVIEGYPIDRAQRPNASVNSLYLGTVELFAAAGFEVTTRPVPGRAVMTLRVAR